MKPGKAQKQPAKPQAQSGAAPSKSKKVSYQVLSFGLKNA
jgi:hypothetical protein